ncbi:hypothetical protein GCM10023215_38920 [Pseudonocardia yuanmonensis]|uniref:Uncharacterized protein n=1 Tax=Pseudonocardia yuanmonensis TaxID=1095914 RepID=A0ABP8WYX9_9PSEU
MLGQILFEGFLVLGDQVRRKRGECPLDHHHVVQRDLRGRHRQRGLRHGRAKLLPPQGAPRGGGPRRPHPRLRRARPDLLDRAQQVRGVLEPTLGGDPPGLHLPDHGDHPGLDGIAGPLDVSDRGEEILVRHVTPAGHAPMVSNI